MQSYFKDEVRIALLSSDEHDQNVSDPQPSSSSPFHQRNNSSPLLSSRTSNSSATVFEFEDAKRTRHNAIASNRHPWFAASESSDSLVGAFIANHFPKFKQKLPSVLGSPGYKQLAWDDSRHKPRRLASRKKALCLLLLAALLLGIGGRQIHKATFHSIEDDAAAPFRASLHDEDSLPDAFIKIPTLPRPLHPHSPDEVLPFDLHHSDAITPATLAPSPSAKNRRQLESIPAQRHMFDKKECLEMWVAQGVVCDALDGIYRKRLDLTNLDLIYTWVNGSDWRHSAAKWMHGYRPTGHWQEYVEEDLFPSAPSSKASKQQTSTMPAPRSVTRVQANSASGLERRAGAQIQSRFRDHEELRFSMRSAAKHLHGLGTIHVVAPDFSAPYHLQPGAHPTSEPSQPRSLWNKVTSALQRRYSRDPFVLNVDRLKEGFVGLPSQLRRVQGLGTDRFTTDEGQLREGQVPQWLSVSNTTNVLAGQEAATASTTWASTSFPESLARLFSVSSFMQSGSDSPKVRLHHDWNAFTDNWLVTEPATAEGRTFRDDYRRAALPTFNSMAVESMLGDQPGLHDSIIYSNDDFFFVDDVSTGDFTSPLFGPVLRLDYNLVVKGKRSPDSTPGEWSSLWHTNWLLDQRFGKRSRPYIQHVHKSFSKSLLQETRIGWAHEHARLGLNRFRSGGDNIVTHFLTYYNVVERHREALLWSFFMLTLDEDGDGLVSVEEVRSALSRMGLTKDQIATAFVGDAASAAPTERNLTVMVKLAKRTTLAGEQVNAALVKAGWPVPLKSQYAFNSQDGYPLGDVSNQVIFRRSDPTEMQRRITMRPSSYVSTNRGESAYYGWPDFVDNPAAHPSNEWFNRRFERTACELKLDQCLVQPFGELESGTVGWEDIFKRFAFVDVKCGDCLIHHLVAQSGERGLSAFLPAADRTYQGKTEETAHYSESVPHLPLTSVWNANSLEFDAVFEAERPCFAVSCVLANSGFGQGTPLRTFASKLIQRYAYTIAETPLQFKQLETQYNSNRVMKALEEANSRPSALERFHQESKGSEAGAWIASQSKVDMRRPALVCINDDITDRFVDNVGTEFTQWMAKMWPQKQPWEL